MTAPRKIKMTERGVSAIPVPGSGQVDYWDTGVSGFGLRVSASGRKTWIFRFRIHGERGRLKLGTYPTTPLSTATAAAKDALRKVETEEDPRGEKADTVKEAFAIYLERHAKAKKRSWRRDELIFEKDVLPAIGRKQLVDVTKRDVLAILDDIVDRGSPVQANRTLEIVRKFFNWCVSRDMLALSPCYGVAKPSDEIERDRVLSEQEVRDFWQAAGEAGPLNCGLFRLRLVTAQRGAEVLSMRWSDFDGQWWTIPADVAKNGLAHRVWLSDLAIEILNEVQEHGEGTEWVFPGADPTKPRSAIHKAHARIKKRAALADYVPHDLRRTASSLMTGMGISRLVVSKILNHVERGVTRVYDRHSYDREK
jgi:integrase